MGSCLQLCLFFFASDMISEMVRAPLLISTADQLFDISYRDSLGHLHQMQAKSAVAAPMPHTMAKNFQSPPRKNSTFSCFPFANTH